MLEFARRPAEDLERIFREVGAQRGIGPHLVEKDFWVCWLLRLIFANAELGEHLVFKGGTSLSKVFGIIQRFSEDIDLSVDPEWLGFRDAAVDLMDKRIVCLTLIVDDRWIVLCIEFLCGGLYFVPRRVADEDVEARVVAAGAVLVEEHFREGQFPTESVEAVFPAGFLDERRSLLPHIVGNITHVAVE